MKINPSWRVLTVGDGDLAFSAALLAHHKPRHLTATIYDDLTTLENKYGLKHYQRLQQRSCQVLTGFDVTKPSSWQGLNLTDFDVVIFQFPLLPNDKTKQLANGQQQQSSNTLNRALLHQYLVHAFKYFLSANGARLAIITSKDVKPYRQWNIEQSLNASTEINYLGQQTFSFADFPGYQLRNVDRDKFVKHTEAFSYYWSDIYDDVSQCDDQSVANVTLPNYLKKSATTESSFCAMCRVGPILTQQDLAAHHASKRHQQMLNFEQQWQFWLNNKAAH
ncbi:class I SAM-dependent methyltransferase [Psychrobium sp. 1_MG-2023]|uniref:class I SAM-dependent methyltransferase n=1 Tax=Psychrobium sp. 1_MG-2023 TaxID=3062624 RepID=UPI000C326ECA|nr:class I SAM-dependent methyltransferase [Psychrobium sp. 1_MG-2023]MDP2562399.1 class I SAM-dependent methyltransferase [Psychrobium sp. 1_MG-2023]PKF55838.1 DUF2431 domain-containing protein [Alteromonadales bacterium alter-6D02]